MSLFSQLRALQRINLTPALLKGAAVVLSEAKRMTPVDTGELLASEHLEAGSDMVFLVADAEHAPHVEFGTSRMAAQPFFRPAIDAKKNEMLKIAAKELGATIERAV